MSKVMDLIQEKVKKGTTKKKKERELKTDAEVIKLLPWGHREITNSLRDCTVVEGLYLVGPMSVPSKSLNLSSIKSSSAIPNNFR